MRTGEHPADQQDHDMNRKFTAKVIYTAPVVWWCTVGGTCPEKGIANAVDADGSGLTDANYLSAAYGVTEAKALLGERGVRALSVIVMHLLLHTICIAMGMLTFMNSGGTVNYASPMASVLLHTDVGYLREGFVSLLTIKCRLQMTLVLRSRWLHLLSGIKAWCDSVPALQFPLTIETCSFD